MNKWLFILCKRVFIYKGKKLVSFSRYGQDWGSFIIVANQKEKGKDEEILIPQHNDNAPMCLDNLNNTFNFLAAILVTDPATDIKYAYIGNNPKSRQDADQYCADNQGWRFLHVSQVDCNTNQKGENTSLPNNESI